MRRLKSLDLQVNKLVALPEDMHEFTVLEELNLASKLFSSASTLVDPPRSSRLSAACPASSG